MMDVAGVAMYGLQIKIILANGEPGGTNRVIIRLLTQQVAYREVLRIYIYQQKNGTHLLELMRQETQIMAGEQRGLEQLILILV